MNIRNFCQQNELHINDSNFYTSLFDCLEAKLKIQVSIDHLKHIVCFYVEEKFFSSSVKKYFYSDETPSTIKNNIMKHKMSNDHITLQAISSNLDVEIHFLWYDGSDLVHDIYPLKEPEVTYKSEQVIYILKTQTNIHRSYHILE